MLEKLNGTKDSKARVKVENKARQCHALSQSSRLLILEYLFKQTSPVLVGDLALKFKFANPTLSHHLRELEHAGLIIRQKKGRQIFCQPSQSKIKELVSFLSSIGNVSFTSSHHEDEDENLVNLAENEMLGSSNVWG